MESEVVACGIQREIGVKLPAERCAVLSGSENNEKSVRADELTVGKHPFPRIFRIVCQAVASEINLGSCIEDFDPVGRVPVRVIEGVSVAGNDLIDSDLSSGGEAEEGDEESCEQAMTIASHR